jgi:hypothetical protein
MAERFEHRPPQFGFEVDLARRAVVEAEPEHKALNGLDARDARCMCAGAHGIGSIVSSGACASHAAETAETPSVRARERVDAMLMNASTG